MALAYNLSNRLINTHLSATKLRFVQLLSATIDTNAHAVDYAWAEQMRTIIATLAMLALLALAKPASGADLKTARECNKEFRSRRSELVSAGITKREFISECWWRSSPGKPTPITNQRADPGRRDAATKASLSKIEVKVTAAQTKAKRAWPTAQGQAAVRQGAQTKPQVKNNIFHTSSARTSAKRTKSKQAAARGTLFQRATISSQKRSRRTAHSTEKTFAPSENFFNARRAWVRQTEIPSRQPSPAVILSSRWAIRRDASLGCWDQDVLFWNRRDGARLLKSKVCRSNIATDQAASASQAQFIAYR